MRPIGTFHLLVSKLAMRLLEINAPHSVVAELAGFPKTRLSEYKHGKRPIPIKHVIALCEVLKCEPSDIVGFEEAELV